MLAKQLQGAALASQPVFIEDTFSTYLYTGTGSTQTITNGIDLAGKGGLVWTKTRANGAGFDWHVLVDSARGVDKVIETNLTNAQATQTDLTAFNSNGYSLGSSAYFATFNYSGASYVSWTFRKQPKFFDVVTYTGTGIVQNIPHNLGSVPGCIIVKSTTSAEWWAVQHRSLGATKSLYLNSTTAEQISPTNWNDTSPTSTQFTVGTNTPTNLSGATFVAYLFAHDAGGFGLTGTDNVISCGSVSATGGTLAEVNLGWEPQWLLIKGSNIPNGWSIIDNMRGFTANNGVSWLQPNTSAAEVSSPTTPSLYLTATGFKVNSNESPLNGTGTYIYIAIRRGPMKTPTTGTSVYNAIARTGTGSVTSITGVGFPPDLAMINQLTQVSGNSTAVRDKLRGPNPVVFTGYTNAESTAYTNGILSFDQGGITVGADTNDTANNNGRTYINWFFRRAPGFFDEVCYTGTGVPATVTHGLTVVPELIILKRRSSAEIWPVYAAPLGATKYLILNTQDLALTDDVWNNTSPTANVFSVNSYAGWNASGSTYVAYLFATCLGVSKVGSYTGTGALQTVNCGFAAGARFVLIKRTDVAGGWHVWDSARGISSGNDPYLLLNSAAAEVTGTNYVDTTAVGFQVTAAAPAALNASGGTFIFLAVA